MKPMSLVALLAVLASPCPGQEASLADALASGQGVRQVAETLVQRSLAGEREVAAALQGAEAGVQATLARALGQYGRDFSSFERLLAHAHTPEVFVAVKMQARRLANQPSWIEAVGTDLVHLDAEVLMLAAGAIAGAGGEAARVQLELAMAGSLGEVVVTILRQTPGNCFDASRLADVAELVRHQGLSEALRVAAADAMGRCGERAQPVVLDAYRSLYPERNRSRADRIVVESLHGWLVQLNGRVDFGADPAGWEPNAASFVPAGPEPTESGGIPLGPINAGGVLLLAVLSLGLGMRKKLAASALLLALSSAMLLVCVAHALRLGPEHSEHSAVMWVLLGLSLPVLGWSLWTTSRLRPWEQKPQRTEASPITRKVVRQRDPGNESSRLLAHALQQMHSLVTPRRGNSVPESQSTDPGQMQAIPALTPARAREIASVEATPRRGFRDFSALEVEEGPQRPQRRAQRMWFKVMRRGEETEIERVDIARLHSHGVEFIRGRSLALGSHLRAIIEKDKGEGYKTRLHVVRCVPLPDRRHRIVANIELKGASSGNLDAYPGEAAVVPTRPASRAHSTQKARPGSKTAAADDESHFQGHAPSGLVLSQNN